MKIALFAHTLATEGRDAGQVEQFAREYRRGTWGEFRVREASILITFGTPAKPEE